MIAYNEPVAGQIADPKLYDPYGSWSVVFARQEADEASPVWAKPDLKTRLFWFFTRWTR